MPKWSHWNIKKFAYFH